MFSQNSKPVSWRSKKYYHQLSDAVESIRVRKYCYYITDIWHVAKWKQTSKFVTAWRDCVDYTCQLSEDLGLYLASLLAVIVTDAGTWTLYDASFSAAHSDLLRKSHVRHPAFSCGHLHLHMVKRWWCIIVRHLLHDGLSLGAQRRLGQDETHTAERGCYPAAHNIGARRQQLRVASRCNTKTVGQLNKTHWT